MTAINWTINEHISIDGAIHKMVGRDKSGLLRLKTLKDGTVIQLTDDQAQELYFDGALERVEAPFGKSEAVQRLLQTDFPDLGEKDKAKAQRKHAYVQAFANRRLRRSTAKVLKPLIAEVALAISDTKPPSVKTMQRTLARWFSVGAPDLRDIRLLLDHRIGKRESATRIQPEVEDILLEVIEKDGMVPERPSADTLLGHVMSRLKTANERLGENAELLPPSLSTVYRYLRDVDDDVAVGATQGQLQVDRLCEPVMRGPQGDMPLHEVEMDHTLLDVIVICAVTNMPIGRPWITVALDRHTRMVVGLHIGFEAPSHRTVAACLRNAILPKRWVRKEYPSIKNDWLAFGVMQRLILDNGPEFHSAHLLEACQQLKIETQYCPVRKPRFKGKVERWFRRLVRQLLHTIPGTTFSNTRERGDYEAEKNAVVTLASLREMILKWIIDDYSQAHHLGINEAPVVRWARETKTNPVAVPSRVGDLDALLDYVEFRELNRKGIQIQGLLYNSRDLRELLNASDRPQRCKIKIDPEDLRVRPVSSLAIAEFPQHKANGRELQESERVMSAVLKVLG